MENKCFFFRNVRCSHRFKSMSRCIEEQCVDCDIYKKYERAMASEDRMVMDEIDNVRKGGDVPNAF